MQRLFLLAVALVLCTSPAFAQSADLAPLGRTAPAIKPASGVSIPLGDSRSLAQLYDNGTIVTGTGNGAGGANTSAVQTASGLVSYGAGHQQNLGNFVSDDFIVPAGGWTISDFEFFTYQTGGTATATTITGVYAQIWNGPPGAAGSTVVFGDLTTNRLASSTFANIYRTLDTDPQATTTNRPVYRNKATINTTLAAGTYWVEWGSTGSLASGPWAPGLTAVGTPPAGNAIQNLGGVYNPLLDGTTPVGLPFIVNGIAGTPSGPILSSSPSSLAFGVQPLNVASAPKTVTLTNPGTAATTITGITTGAPFSVSTTGTSLTLAPGATTTFTVTFTPTTPGAKTGTVSVASNAPGSPLTIALTGTGQPPPPDGTYPSTDTPVAIPDNSPAGITSTIIVPGAVTGTIADLDVDLNIAHTWAGDVIATLTKGAASSTLIDRPGVPVTSTVGCSGDNYTIIADDEGTAGSIETSCVSSTAPAYPVVGGRYTPSTPLSVFDASTLAGTYVLTVSDNASGDTGTINSWALLITKATTAGEGSGASFTSRMSVAPNPMRGTSQIDLTVGTSQDVRVAIYDALGREVAVVLNRAMVAGQQAFVGVNTESLPSGVYVVRATGTDLNLTQRVTVVR